MQTKFSKSFVSTFFPVDDDIQTVVVDWVNYLRRETTGGAPQVVTCLSSYYCLEKTQLENHVSDFMQPASKNARSVFASLRVLNSAEALEHPSNPEHQSLL